MTEMRRASNFCDEEQYILVNLVLNKYKNAIENKITNACSNRRKHAAWETLTNIYNELIPRSRKRTSRTLRLKYENIKKCLRKKIGRMKLEQTTGSNFFSTLKDFEKPLVSLMGIPRDRLPIQIDDPYIESKPADHNDPGRPLSQPTSDSPFREILFKQEIPVTDNTEETPNQSEDVIESLFNFENTKLRQSNPHEEISSRPKFEKRHKRVLQRELGSNNMQFINPATNWGQLGENDLFDMNQPTYKNNHKKLGPEKYTSILDMVKKYDLLADKAMEYFGSKISVMKEESSLTKEVLRRKIEILELEKELLQHKVNEVRNK